jgi:hypothetical protein
LESANGRINARGTTTAAVTNATITAIIAEEIIPGRFNSTSQLAAGPLSWARSQLSPRRL